VVVVVVVVTTTGGRKGLRCHGQRQRRHEKASQ
jgi:hypothetical protein